MSRTAMISILIAQGDEAVRADVTAILAGAADMEIVGVARTGAATLALARQLEPSIVLVDDALPGCEGLDTIEALTAIVPQAGMIVLSADRSAEALRRAMIAGARQFVELPARPEELRRAIYQVHDTLTARRVATGWTGALGRPPTRRAGQTIAVFSPKGGAGTTTVATNLAVAIRQEAGLRVALVDGALPFGDVGVFLDLTPTRSIMDLQEALDELDAASVDRGLLTHARSGVKVLLAPARPEMAELVTGDLLRRVLELLRERAEYVVVDTWSALDERVLTVLEAADTIVLVTTLDFAAVKSARVFLEVADLLQVPHEKIVLVATRTTAPAGLTTADVAAVLKRPVAVCIPDDSATALRAINEGDPLMLSAPGTPIATAITTLARRLIAAQYPDVVAAPAGVPVAGARLGRRRLFGRADLHLVG